MTYVPDRLNCIFSFSFSLSFICNFSLCSGFNFNLSKGVGMFLYYFEVCLLVWPSFIITELLIKVDSVKCLGINIAKNFRCSSQIFRFIEEIGRPSFNMWRWCTVTSAFYYWRKTSKISRQGLSITSGTPVLLARRIMGKRCDTQQPACENVEQRILSALSHPTNTGLPLNYLGLGQVPPSVSVSRCINIYGNQIVPESLPIWSRSWQTFHTISRNWTYFRSDIFSTCILMGWGLHPFPARREHQCRQIPCKYKCVQIPKREAGPVSLLWAS